MAKNNKSNKKKKNKVKKAKKIHKVKNKANKSIKNKKNKNNPDKKVKKKGLSYTQVLLLFSSGVSIFTLYILLLIIRAIVLFYDKTVQNKKYVNILLFFTLQFFAYFVLLTISVFLIDTIITLIDYVIEIIKEIPKPYKASDFSKKLGLSTIEYRWHIFMLLVIILFTIVGIMAVLIVLGIIIIIGIYLLGYTK
jgi:hypothetical protein